MTKVSPHSSCMDVWWSWIQDFSDRNKDSWCKQAPCASRLQAALYQCKDAVLPAQNDAASEVRKAAAHTWGRSTNIIKLRVGKPKFYVLQAGLHFTHLPSSLPAHQRQLSVCTCGTKITRALFHLRGREELSSPQLRPASGYYLSSRLAALLWAALLIITPF